MKDFCIIANVCMPDSCMRQKSKAWLVGGTGGEGWERFVWIARSKGGRLVKKWSTTKKFNNFRCAFIPDHIREMAGNFIYLNGDRKEMEKVAHDLNEFRDNLIKE